MAASKMIGTMAPSGPDVRALQGAVSLLSRAAEVGQDALFSEAKVLFRSVMCARDVRILVRAGSSWRDWNKLDSDDCVEPVFARLADDVRPSDDLARYDRFIIASVSVASVAVIVETAISQEPPDELLQTLCEVLRLALGSCESRYGNPDKLEAIKVFQRVANRILKSGNLNEIFTQITHEAKIRLSADICGIMLKEEDWLVMQRCVGNLAAETASLRMRSGQGVGGRVFETREPCTIEDYVRSEIISRDFFDLARAERVRSALAVPLLSHDRFLGVLEVWRRRPSQFTPQHTAELATLANLTSLAIENVRLAEAREAAGRRLESAHAELKSRYEVIRMSAELQENLNALLLAGGGLSEIPEMAPRHLGGPVVILDRRLGLEAWHPPDLRAVQMLPAIRSAIPKGGNEVRTFIQTAGKVRLYGQRVIAAAEHLGWVAVLDRNPPDRAEQLALGEVSVTIALHQMKERAAARALTDKLSSLLWDLIEAPEHLCRVARDRIKDLGVDLSGASCVLVCQFEERDRRGADRTKDRVDLDSWRQALSELPIWLPSTNRMVRLCTIRADELIVVAALREGTGPSEVAKSLSEELDRRIAGAVTRIGVSREVAGPEAIPSACKDARVALAVTRQAGGNRILAVDEIGVAGLLMSLRDGADFKEFVAEKLSVLLQQSPAQREVLLSTLRTYFAANCSQRTTAQKLRVHQKTIAYRLEKIERMTGLDMSTHETRMLLDLALRMNDLLN